MEIECFFDSWPSFSRGYKHGIDRLARIKNDVSPTKRESEFQTLTKRRSRFRMSSRWDIRCFSFATSRRFSNFAALCWFVSTQSQYWSNLNGIELEIQSIMVSIASFDVYNNFYAIKYLELNSGLKRFFPCWLQPIKIIGKTIHMYVYIKIK